MTNAEKRAFLVSVLGQARKDVTDAVDQEQRTNGGSFVTAWNRVKQRQPDLFSELDRAAGAIDSFDIGDIGSQEGQPFHNMPVATAPNNVPSEPGAKPTGQRADDPRARGDSKYVQRPRDARIQGVTTRPALRVF
jgi:hypothetical protein